MSSLRKSVYDCENGGVVMGRWQAGDKIECDVRPGAVWYGEWLQEALWGLVRDLGLSEDRSSSYEISNVLPHPRPTKLALNESEGSVVTWVAGESGGMAPLE